MGLLLELLAQVANVHVDRARVAVGAVAPDRAEQLLAIEETSGLLHQRRHQLELRERELYRLAVCRDLALAAVEGHVLRGEHLLAEHARIGAAQDRADATAELGEAERLG